MNFWLDQALLVHCIFSMTPLNNKVPLISCEALFKVEVCKQKAVIETEVLFSPLFCKIEDVLHVKFLLIQRSFYIHVYILWNQKFEPLLFSFLMFRLIFSIFTSLLRNLPTLASHIAFCRQWRPRDFRIPIMRNPDIADVTAVWRRLLSRLYALCVTAAP